MGLFEDMQGGIGSSASDIMTGLNITIVGVMGMLFIPLMLVWGILSFYILYLLFLRNYIPILPFKNPIFSYYAFRVIVSKPYGDGSIGLWLDRGALCRLHGLSRFKIKTENFLMQRMDTYDIYQDASIHSVNVVSLGPSKKFFGKRTIDFENRKMIIGVENPDVAQVVYLDHMTANQPDYLAKYSAMMSQLFTYWTIITCLLIFATTVVVYPLFLWGIGKPFGMW